MLQFRISSTTGKQRADRIGQALERFAVVNHGSLGLTHLLVGSATKRVGLTVVRLGLEDHCKVWDGALELA